MGVVICYVNDSGCVIEYFLGLVHVSDTTATSLEKVIDSLFSTHELSISSLRSQGYDGATKKNAKGASFFNTVTRLCNVVGGSCKRRDILQEAQMKKVTGGIANDDINTVKGRNQEMTLKQPGDTRWSSHYGTIINLISLYSSVIEVLEHVEENGVDDSKRAKTLDLLDIINRFEFVFVLHLMRKILGITHNLSQALQRMDQDIVYAMSLLKVSKSRLQSMRDEEWDALLIEVSNFCSKHEINVLNMEDMHATSRRSRRKAERITNLYHYHVELCYSVIDLQAHELYHHFDEVITELLLCMTCFDPRDSFSAFDKNKLLRLAEFYPSDFSETALIELDSQLENFIVNMRLDENFSTIDEI